MSDLPRGVRIDKGYVQVRIAPKGKTYCKNFGRDSALARELAIIHLSEKRKEILLGKFGVQKELPEKQFAEVIDLYAKRWCAERTPEGALAHTQTAQYNLSIIIDRSIKPFFKRSLYHEIRPKDIIVWREKRLLSVKGTTINREQVVLSSLFAHVERWVKNEQIKPFKIPVENPCATVEKAPTKKRSRLVTPYEISKLKNAARELGDENARENISLFLKSCLSSKDIKTLKLGDTVDLIRAKSGVPVVVPITVLYQPSWKNWRVRWTAIRKKAGLEDIQERDLRKAGINLLIGRGHDMKLISQYAGHADLKTTEQFYAKMDADKLSVLAKDISDLVDAL